MHICCGRPDRSLVFVGSLLRCLSLNHFSVYELALSCSVFSSLLETCVLFSIVCFCHLQRISQSVSHLHLSLFSLISLNCAFVSHTLSSPSLFFFSSFTIMAPSYYRYPSVFSFTPHTVWGPSTDWLAMVCQDRSSCLHLALAWNTYCFFGSKAKPLQHPRNPPHVWAAVGESCRLEAKMWSHPSSPWGTALLSLNAEKERNKRWAASFQACHLCLVNVPHLPCLPQLAL